MSMAFPPDEGTDGVEGTIERSLREDMEQDAWERGIVAMHGRGFRQVQALYAKWGWSVDEIRDLEPDEFKFRVACMAEELSEYVAARTREDQLDALVDLRVFVDGTAVRHGFDRFEEAVDRVLIANSRKIAGPVRGQRGESAFDLAKPEGWQAPDLTDLVDEFPDIVSRPPLDRRLEDDEIHKAVLFDDDRDIVGSLKSQLAAAKEGRRHEEREIAVLRDWLHQRDRTINGLQHDLVRRDEEVERLQDLEDTVASQAETIEVLKAAVARPSRSAHAAEDELSKIPPAFREAAALCAQKCEDYGQWDLSKREYHPYGHTSYLQMLHTKLTRLKSVAEQEATNFESARDSVIDLINYAGFYAAWMDEEEKS